MGGRHTPPALLLHRVSLRTRGVEAADAAVAVGAAFFVLSVLLFFLLLLLLLLLLLVLLLLLLLFCQGIMSLFFELGRVPRVHRPCRSRAGELASPVSYRGSALPLGKCGGGMSGYQAKELKVLKEIGGYS